MTHPKGKHLGGISDMESMRLRCFCDAHTGCWHLRTARGKHYKPGQTQAVWIHGHDHMSATRAMWMFATGKPPQPGLVVMRTCDSHDCVNPAHLKCGTRKTAVRNQAKRGKLGADPATMRANLSRGVERWRVLTPELRQWLLESTQSGADAAAALGISQGHANLLRREARTRLQTAAPSIFSIGQAVNAARLRRAA